MITATKELAAKHQHFHDLVGDETVSYTMLDYISTTAVNTGVAYVTLLDKSTEALEDRIEAEKYQALLVHRNPLKRRIIPAQDQPKKDEPKMTDYSAEILTLEVQLENVERFEADLDQTVTIVSGDGQYSIQVPLRGLAHQVVTAEANTIRNKLTSAQEAIQTLRTLFPNKD